MNDYYELPPEGSAVQGIVDDPDHVVPPHLRAARRAAERANRAGHPVVRVANRTATEFDTPTVTIPPPRRPTDDEFLGSRTRVTLRNTGNGEVIEVWGTITQIGWWLHLGEKQHMAVIDLEDGRRWVDLVAKLEVGRSR